jgi:hypothetical protein
LKVTIKAAAQETLDEIAALIDGINTPGAGDRWIDRILDLIQEHAQPNLQYALCHNEILSASLFSCITFNNWVIVFRIEDNVLNVYQIIYGSVLK